jgi:peptidyl-prolyl cis-trans isomerase D
MLQAIRERAQGWIAWAIVILISIPFALWGIQEYLGVGSEPVAATVEGDEITERELDRRFQEFRMELRERLGRAYRPELFDDARMRQEVLDDMIRNRVILQASLDMGIRAGDAQVRDSIMAVPAFQRDGRFDKEAYERVINMQGMSSNQFEQRVRGSLMASQLSQVVGSSEFITDAELADAVRLRNQRRRFDYVILPLQRFESEAPVSEQEIQAYYDDNPEAFEIPEQVKVRYLVVDRAGSADADVDEAALRSLYQSRVDTYRTAEQRRARHILITVEVDAGPEAEQAARQQLDAIQARLQAGESFADVAADVSQDPGSKEQGGDLGLFGRGVMDPAFEAAVFSLEPGVVSEPVRSAFGYHLIEVTDIQPETVKPFEAVRDDLARSYRSEAAERQYFELAERLGNLAYENPDSLVPAAEALGLEVESSEWLDRNGGEGVLANPKVIGAAFSDDVLRQGNNSDVIEVQEGGSDKAVVVRVAEHREPSLKPLDEVKEQIVETIRIDRARTAAAEAAESLAQRLRDGEELAAAASDYGPKQTELVDRNAPGLPSELIATAFTLPAPGDGGASVGVSRMRSGSAAVVVLRAVEDGALAEADGPEQNDERRALSRTLARTYFDNLVTALRREADVRILTKASE